MKIAVSNILWKKGKQYIPEFFSALSNHGIDGVELALSCFWEEPTEISNEDIKWLKLMLSSYQLKLVSLHSLTYSRPDLELFGGHRKRKDLIDYLKKYCELANNLDCQNIVFGSPKSRTTYGLNRDELDKIFIDVLYEIDKNANSIFFNIEPLAKNYCNYLNSYMESALLIGNENFKNIFIQLDVRSIIESREGIDDIFQNYRHIKHVHAGNPSLKLPGSPFVKIHKSISKKLTSLGYDGYITAEVLNHNEENMQKYLDKTVHIMRELYG